MSGKTCRLFICHTHCPGRTDIEISSEGTWSTDWKACDKRKTNIYRKTAKLGLQKGAIIRRMSWPLLSSRSRGSSKLQSVDEQVARTAASPESRSNEKNLSLRERYGSPAPSPTTLDRGDDN